MHPYIPHTEKDIEQMLKKIGVTTIEALFSDIPDAAMLNRSLDLPDAHSERAMLKRITAISRENIDADAWLRFVGGGLYEHMIPSVIPQMLLRSEFNTAYTPYQPEISQGTLQAIFEYQTMMTELTGLDVANASHYDGATAMAEAAFMACGATRRRKILVADTLNPQYMAVLKTYLNYKDLELVPIPSVNRTVSMEVIEKYLDEETGAYIVATPNYYGLLEDLTGISDLLHSNGSMLIIAANPMSFALYKSPGEWGADIAVGDGQVFGNAMNFGGPSLGYIACTTKLMRKMPGRIVGETVDLNGKRGYVLTLQAREQHIRREKATSNITSNQALNALAATIYLSLLGLKGIREVAGRSRINAHYLKRGLTAIDGITAISKGPFFNEFVIGVPDAEKLMEALEAYQIVPGIMLNNREILVTTTEIYEKSDLDAYIEAVREVL